MPREIKFRAWDKMGKRMTTGLYLDFQGRIGIWNHEETEIEFGTIRHVDLMQYTGLKDKNGKEIYEGDIVKSVEKRYKSDWPEYKPILEHEAEVRHSVCFEDGSFLFRHDTRVEAWYAWHPTIWGNEYHRYEYSNDRISVEAEFSHRDFGKRDFVRYESFEVIGNIYENPELMEAQNVKS